MLNRVLGKKGVLTCDGLNLEPRVELQPWLLENASPIPEETVKATTVLKREVKLYQKEKGNEFSHCGGLNMFGSQGLMCLDE